MTGIPNRAIRGKSLAAVLGGAAVVAMGAINVLNGGGASDGTALVSSGSMSTGQTTTVQYSTVAKVAVAVPVVKASPYGQS
ncbi:MAG: hypothetical protein ACRDUX_29970 [Mycobacterium sp.]